MTRKKKTVKKKTTKKRRTPQDVDASEKVKKLNEREALLFGKLDAEMRNNLQGMSICDFQTSELKRNYQDKLAQLTNMKMKHQQEIDRLKPEYDDLLQKLSEKYGVPTKTMVIDPDTGTVRNAVTDV